jgi:predicted Zn-dependent protease
MLIAAHIDPEGLAEFFETLEEEQDGEIPVWMSTHPKPGGRAQAVRDQVFELSSTPDWEPLDIDWDAVIERLDQV